MGIFSVKLAAGDRFTIREGSDMFIVSAEDAADAKAICKAKYSGAAGDAAWAASTATALADVAANAANALVGWRFRVAILDSPTVVDITVTGDATDDTLDEVGTELAVQLNLDSQIANAAYVGATQTLTIAGAADALGDMKVLVEVYPPLELDASGVQQNQDSPIPGFVGTITDEGASGAALTVVFGADTLVVPQVLQAGTAR